MPERARTEVLLVDDHPVFRQGVRMLLEGNGFAVSGEAGTTRDALSLINNRGADVALLDLALACESGLTLMEPLREKGIPAVVCSMHDDHLHVEQALTAGASGYVTKAEAGDTLLEALRSVLRGRPYLSPLADDTLTDETEPLVRMGTRVQLSRREDQVLQYLSAGYSLAEMASRLDVSARTVETYANRLINKLQLAGMRELRHYAAAVARGPRSG
ncbi:MAG: response regulator transcription factor [Acidobacteriota bacterium]